MVRASTYQMEIITGLKSVRILYFRLSKGEEPCMKISMWLKADRLKQLRPVNIVDLFSEEAEDADGGVSNLAYQGGLHVK